MSPVIHDTFVIERTYPKTVAAVFAAFSDPSKKQRWFGYAAEVFELDFRVGGREVSRGRLGEDTPLPGVSIVAEGEHLDIAPDERIVIAATMTVGGSRISAGLYTFEFQVAGEGTKLTFTHQAAFFENADGPQIRRSGWEQLLDRLAQSLAN